MLSKFCGAASPGKVVRPQASEFEKRFRELQLEWDTLQKQLQELVAKKDKS
jgi:hypothetical protein